MTRLLEFLRREERQSIVATHHPHVIFSERVDKVIYLEMPRPGRMKRPPRIMNYAKGQFQTWPKRKAVSLEDAFELVTYAYKLFDLHDTQLLRQASRIASEADIELFRILHEIYRRDPKPATERVFPDRQPMQLNDRIRSFLAEAPESEQVIILDLGAGLGRVATEVSKLTRWQLEAKIHWICWEPDEAKRVQLRKTLNEKSVSADTPNSVQEIAESSAHLALIANVLHELTPDQFADLLTLADSRILSDDGCIVILELYPLLHSEKYAVPYPDAILREILNDSGFTTDCEMIPVGGGIASAYCILWRRQNRRVAVEGTTIKKNVEAAWGRLQRDAISAYANRRGFRSFTQYRALLQDMTVIASVAAWQGGFWR